MSPHIRFHPALNPLMRPIEEVSAHPDNANNGDVDAIVQSIEINGMYGPVAVQKSTGYILRGNHTYYACLELGSQVIPVIELDVDDEAALRILEGDNKIARLARMDAGLTLKNLQRLMETEKGLLGTGWVEEEVAALVDSLEESHGFGQPDHTEEEILGATVECPNCGHPVPVGAP